MKSFKELYESTIKIVPCKDIDISYIDNDPTINNIENKFKNDNNIGGFIDLNINTPQKINKVKTDYSRIDPISIYRNKVSLKNEPYDIEKTKILYARTSPGSESFTSWLKSSEQSKSIEKRRYNNFVRWLDNNARNQLFTQHAATGVQKIPIESVSGVDMHHFYMLVDFDYRIIWNYVLEKDRKYIVITQPSRITGDDVPRERIKAITDYKKATNIKTYYTQYTEDNFYSNQTIRDYFLHPDKYPVIDRDLIKYSMDQNSTKMQELFKGNNPFLPYLQEGSKALYDAYVNVQVDSVNNNNNNSENEEEVKKS